MPKGIRKGLYKEKAAPALAALNVSVGFDKRLYRQDIEGSKAHARMLASSGILTKKEAATLEKGLSTVALDIAKGRFRFKAELEDIHMNIEAALEKKIGKELAGKLHTARSRNDQVALSFRLYVREEIDRTDASLKALQKVLLDQAQTHAQTIMPGFTHMQNGQAITFGHHALAYVEMLARDRGRFGDARRRLNQSPLGAGALAGTSFPIKPQEVAKALGFDGVSQNALDAVSDRDFVLESLSAVSITAVHLSRLAEEIILWVSPAFDFARLPESFTTGSSMMPQKRNPDAAELIRAQSGRAIGALMDMLVVMKSLPLAYAKDMQQDKEALFQGFDRLALSLDAMAGMVRGLLLNPDKMRALAAQGHACATDLADWLVQKKNIPFRAAHAHVGALVRLAEQAGKNLEDLTLKEMQSVFPDMTRDVYDILSLEKSVASRKSLGGTAPTEVRARVKSWKARLAREKS